MITGILTVFTDPNTNCHYSD